jgi:hypothetical protein
VSETLLKEVLFQLKRKRKKLGSAAYSEEDRRYIKCWLTQCLSVPGMKILNAYSVSDLLIIINTNQLYK